MNLEYNMTPEILSSLDWIAVTDIEEETSGTMTVIDTAQVDGAYYLLAVEAEPDASIPEDFDDDAEDSDEEAYLLKLCNKDQAEFMITEEYGDMVIYASTDFSEEEFDKVSAVLASQADDQYDIMIEGKEERDNE